MKNIRRKKLKDGNPNQIQQGDVLLEAAKVPNEATPVEKKGILAEGEGHHEHAFVDPAAVKFFTFDENMYVKVVKETKAAHRVKGTEHIGEHSTLNVRPGEYTYRPVIERDWLAKLNRKVVD